MLISSIYLPVTQQSKKYINRDMEEIEAAKPIDIKLTSLSPVTQDSEPLETKEYELNLNKDTYLLKMQLSKHEKISFKIRQTNNLFFYYYYKEFGYEELRKALSLPVEHYDNISKVFKFYDTAVLKNKVFLVQEKGKKGMVLLLKITLFFEDIESKIFLNEIRLTNEEMITILFDEIKQIKMKGLPKNIANENENNKKDENKNDIINKLLQKIEDLESTLNKLIKNKADMESKLNELIKNNEENNKEKRDMENKIKLLTDENKKMKENLDKYVGFIEERMKETKKDKDLKEKIKEENDNFIKNNINVEFKEDPQNLQFRETLTNISSSNNQRDKFAVYINLKDHIEYLVFNNKNTHNLDIMRIKDKTIITSLKGHNCHVIVIRYYMKDNKEEYLLSCDENKLVIVWDIQNYFNKKYTIQTKYSSYIYDALLLFNIFNKNYILLSNFESKEYSKLYEFKENIPFVRNIYGTNNHKTYFMIPWLYQNKYYIIECSYKKIFINNLLEDEIYANLNMNPEGYYYNGYLYNNNYLCLSDYINCFLRIWDLVNKVIYKQINYDSSIGTCSYEIMPWNNKYSIFGCDSGWIVIMNLEEGKMAKKIQLKDSNEIRGMKKIKLAQSGECLICSDNNGNIKLLSL